MCISWAELKLKNQKESSVNQSDKEANSNKQKNVTTKQIKWGKSKVLKLGFEFIFGIGDT